MKAAYLGTIIAQGWPSPLVPNSGRMKSSLGSARVVWEKCIAQGFRPLQILIDRKVVVRSR